MPKQNQLVNPRFKQPLKSLYKLGFNLKERLSFRLALSVTLFYSSLKSRL
jgi:hypothetical protein